MRPPTPRNGPLPAIVLRSAAIPAGRLPLLRAALLASLLTLALAAALPERLRAEAAPPRITLFPASVETGDALVVEIDGRPLQRAAQEYTVSFAEQRLALFAHPVKGRGVHVGLAAVPLSAPPGTASLTVAWVDGGRPQSRRIPFHITAGAYGEERLRVDPRHVQPSPPDLERIRREQEKLKRVYASGSPSRLWSEGFQLPVPGEVSGPFGTRRVFNGELRSQHSGLDFRSQTGEPVHASGAGVVKLAEELFYSGNAVIVDHGAGVFSSYSHLSRIQVGVGQRVERGQRVGLIGATGRATGPHLHWGVKVNSVNVNPLSFIRATAALSP
ncbi:MAG: M23 family metallopeptidase [Desulfobacterales bacterium]|jgi:murein DD-endopeptidase MepM/ murein hydrolase activator NlpD|nr:M23 family metallopeptidase [Desulfobacterales bacterium]